MKKTAFQKILLLAFAPVLAWMLAACIFIEEEEQPEPTVTIRGKMTVTRNGIPWNLEDCRYDERWDSYTLPRVTAYIGKSDLSDRFYLGRTGYTYNDVSWFGNGKYQWFMEIPESRLPCTVYFLVENYMEGVMGSPPLSAYPAIITEGFWIRDAYPIIDLGAIDFRVIQISGNLPVSVDGEPLDETGRASIFVKGLNRSFSSSATIQANGDWSLNFLQPDSEETLQFEIYIYLRENYISLYKELNADTEYTVYDIDREIIFPDYSGIDFETFTLSGTIKTTGGYGDIRFTAEDFGIQNIRRYSAYSYIEFQESDGECLVEWQMRVPAFSFPQTLRLTFDARLDGVNYDTKYDIDITEEADLSNINLVFSR